ncbi:MAG: bifunctional adenosylcobinamide kinase/adenosylcobinamide-phosphate guanylyltransferase [Alphaproteobacteria bacterium]|nr:bifunctional adenosylcobinamide kinase/adenosylcobinamide-phosphate guanylyltransferase [Alphaproteobacteria bacterium]
MPAALPLPPLTLVLGGTRSGKSAHAESLAVLPGVESTYLATASAGDGEMAERIRRHQERRGTSWRTVEEPVDLPGVLRNCPPGAPILIDCLTLWLSNLLLAGRDPAAEAEALLDALRAPPGPVIAVASEVGLGIVPENALARLFRDHAGLLNQRVAGLADRVVFVAAGLPLVLKDVHANPLEPPCPQRRSVKFPPPLSPAFSGRGRRR